MIQYQIYITTFKFSVNLQCTVQNRVHILPVYRPILLQEAQLPERNSASAARVYLGRLTDRAMHRTPQNRRGCTTIFWHSNALIPEALAEKRILAWNSHSRSFKVIHFAISYWPTRVSISSYNIVQWAPAKDASMLQQSAGRKRILTSNSQEASFLQQSAFWPFNKVIQGRWFWYQSTVHMRLPISD